MYKYFHMREERTKEVSKREGGGAKEGRTETFQLEERTDERARVCVTDGRTVGLRIWHGMQDVSMALAVVVSQ